MSRFRQPDGPAPCPVTVMFPPAPTGRHDETLFAGWGDLLVTWHRDHAIAGVSELGTHVDVLRLKQARRELLLAWRGQLDHRQGIRCPACWSRRWHDRPAWMRQQFRTEPGGPNTVVRVIPAGSRT